MNLKENYERYFGKLSEEKLTEDVDNDEEILEIIGNYTDSMNNFIQKWKKNLRLSLSKYIDDKDELKDTCEDTFADVLSDILH